MYFLQNSFAAARVTEAGIRVSFLFLHNFCRILETKLKRKETMFTHLLLRKIKYLMYEVNREREAQGDPPEVDIFEAAEETMPPEPGPARGPKTPQKKKLRVQPPKSLQERIAAFKKELGDTDDIKVREFCFGPNKSYSAAVVYIDGLTDHQLIIDSILRPLIKYEDFPEGQRGDVLLDFIKNGALLSDDTEESAEVTMLADTCLNGNTVLIVNGCEKCLSIGTKGWDFRSITEPQTEPVVKGPREGFTENFRTNTSMIRRKIKSPALRMDSMKIGRKTSTDVAVIYLENVAKPELVATVKARLKGLDVDSIMETGYLEEYIEDNPFSIFSTIGYTEKPDVAAAKILEGRVAVVVDGTPFVLTMPAFFVESFQTAEDYYNRPFYASLTRLMRLLSYFFAVYSLPIFIALTTFHQELLPSTLLFTIANAREGTPFPVVLEGLILILSFEILREAGLRLPRPIGQAISIVGALVMGEAAVSAGLVGSPIVIVVAISAVAGFAIPQQSDTISITRLIMMGLAAFLGGFGLALGFLALLLHLAKLKSFGVPFFASVNPTRDLQDSFIRVPLWQMEYRPTLLAGNDKKRKIKKEPPVPETADAQNQ